MQTERLRQALLVLALPGLLQAQVVLRDLVGLHRPAQWVEIPFTGGPIRYETHKVVTQRGEVPWQQLSNGNLLVEARRPGSVPVYEYPLPAGFITNCGSDCILLQRGAPGPFRLGTWVKFLSNAPGGASVDTPYCIVSDTGSIDTQSSKQIKISSTCGGSPITFSSSPDTVLYKTAFVRVGNNIDCPECSNYQSGDPVVFECRGVNCALPTGLTAGTTYFLKPESGTQYSIWSDPGLTSQVTLASAGSGAFTIWDETVWQVQSGPTTVFPTNRVRAEIGQGGHLEVTNGLTGLRLVTAQSQTSPPGLAPVQGIRWRDGSWTATGPNLLYRENIDPNWRNGRWARSPIGDVPGWGADDPAQFRFTVLERGPLLVKVRYEYTWPVRPDYTQPGVGTSPSEGPGLMLFEYEVFADRPFVTELADFNMAAGYYLDLGITADRVRRRRHGQDDEELDFPVQTSLQFLGYSTTNENAINHGCSTADKTNSNWWGCLQSGGNTMTGVGMNRYAMVYQGAGGPTSKLFGWISGWTELCVRCGRGLSFTPSLSRVGESPIHGVDRVILHYSHPIYDGMGNVYYRRRGKHAWYIGEKGDIPQIGGDTSMLAHHRIAQIFANEATMGLSREISWPKPSDPVAGCDWDTQKPCGWVWPYHTSAHLTSLRGRVRSDSAFYNERRNISLAVGDGVGQWLLDMWRFNDPAMGVRQAELETFKMFRWRQLQGNLTQPNRYEAMYSLTRHGPLLFGALVDENTTAGLRERAVRSLALLTGLFTDPRWYNHDTGDSPGLQNQQLQTIQQEDMAVLGASHWFRADRVAQAVERSRNSILTAIREDGATVNSTEYHETVRGPSSGVERFLIHTGQTSPSERQARWVANQVFNRRMLSPPDLRFNPPRRCEFLTGDGKVCRGGTPSLRGKHGEFLFDDPAGMWLWNNHGKPCDSFYFTCQVTVPDIPDSLPADMTSASYPNYFQFGRHHFESVDESYFVLESRDAFDHMHTAKTGSLTVFALRAPISTHFPSVGAPHVVDRRVSGTMMLESSLSQAWDADSHPVNGTGALTTSWGAATKTEFLHFSNATLARASFGSNPTWVREVALLADDPANPVFVVRDSFAGSGSTANKVRVQNFHGTGAISVPGDSSYSPVLRQNNNNGVLPSNGKTAPTPSNFSLPSNTANLLQFTGQNGVDFKVYAIPIGGSGSLGHVGHWDPPAQGGAARGNQYIFRWRHNGDYLTVILPYRSGEEPGGRTVAYNTAGCPNGVEILYSNTRHCVTQDRHEYSNGSVSVLRTFGSSAASYAGLTIAGGPASCTLASSVTCQVTGMTPSVRTVTLPSGTWRPDRPLIAQSGQQFLLAHPGGGDVYTVSWADTGSTSSKVFRMAAPSGASTARLYFNGEGLVQVDCTACNFSVSAPQGTYTLKHVWVASGAEAYVSTERSVQFD